MENKKKCFTNPDGVDFIISEDYIYRTNSKLYQAWKYNTKNCNWVKVTSSASVTDVLDTVSKKAATCPETSTDKYLIEWRRD